MENGKPMLLLIVAKLTCCLLLPLAAAGAFSGIGAWFAERPISWLLVVAGAVGGFAWLVSMNRKRCCPPDREHSVSFNAVTYIIDGHCT